MLSGCIVSMTPKKDQTLCPGESMTFSIVDAAQDPKVYEWTLDGVPVRGATGTSCTYSPTANEVGSHKLKVQVSWDYRTWNIEVPNCTTWTVEPMALDFGYIQTEKIILVHNTGGLPLTLSADLKGTSEFVTDVNFLNAPIAPGESREVSVKVSRQNLSSGAYSTSFVLKSDKGNTARIFAAMNVGIAKILFSVDTSGSMAGNDPQNKRVSAVKETISKFYDNQNISYGIIAFNDNAKILTGFTRDRNLLDYYADFLGGGSGWTTYLSGGAYSPGALNAIDQVINEIELGTHFAVIFLSDGELTQGNTGHDPIIAKVSSITAFGNVKFYTVYLNGNPSPSARQLLNDMAIAGGTAETHVYTDPESLSFIKLDF